MSARISPLRVGSLAILAVLLMVATAGAAVATKRLSTGLPSPQASDDLPQAWAAPVKQPPTIDGRLDDKVWETTRPLVLGKLERYGEASPLSAVRFLHQGGVLYVGASLGEPDVQKLKRSAAKHDGPTWDDDSLELFLQPDVNQDYYQLVISASGAIYDRQDHDESAGWDSRAKAVVAVGPEGWSLEATIPMASLGAGGRLPERWRVNVYRNRRAGGGVESQAWSPTLCGDYDVPERFGYLLLTPQPPWAGEEKGAGRTRGLSVQRIGEEQAVLLFDLAGLPKGAPVYRAWLQCERRALPAGDPRALADVEIYPLAAPYQKDSPPKTAAEALRLVPPWYQAFDMTELVRGWTADKPNYGVYVKAFPGWQVHKTSLDLMYEGVSGGLPPQASGLKTLHRAGQTFLTWKEIDDPVGKDDVTWGELRAILSGLDAKAQTRYCVYRSGRPITAANLAAAELLATVKPLSCWNINGRNIERPIDMVIATQDYFPCGQWNPFGSASLDGDFGRDCPIDRLVIQDSGRPLARGTGLYVHTPPGKGKAYYAVVTMVDGVANTVDLSPKNVTGAVEETPGDPAPVLQKELPRMPLFNYADQRLHYVHWVAGPEFANVPSQYYNWSVAVPEALSRGEKAAAVPLELTLHRDADSYWRTQFRMERNSVVLAPHDFPIRTGWYGYHESLGTLRSYGQGVIRPYTERRLLAFMDWAARKWPIDRNKIIVTGCRDQASASGALHLGLRHPEVFALVVSGHGSPTYAELAVSTDRKGLSEAAKGLQAAFGHPDWKLKTDGGKSVWDEHDMNRLVAATPAAADLPLVAITSGNEGSIRQFHRLMLESGRPIVAEFSWGGGRYIPVTASETFPNAVRLDIRRNLSMLAFNSETARKTLTGGMGEFNRDVTWRDPVEGPDKYEVIICCLAAQASASDVTLRRLQRFKVEPGKTYRWVIAPVDDGQDLRKPARKSKSAKEELPPSAQGDAIATKDGVLTLKALPLAGEVKLTVTVK